MTDPHDRQGAQRLAALERLGREIALEQDQRLERVNYQACYARFAQASRGVSSRASTRFAPALWGVAAAAALALAYMASRHVVPEPIAFTVGHPQGSQLEHAQGSEGEWIVAGAQKSLALRFTDGTEIALKPSSRARVLQLRERGAEVLIERGGARVHVVPDRQADWQIRAGAFNVRVTGTRFEIDYGQAQERFELRVTEGSVVLTGCGLGQGTAVRAGESLEASCREQELALHRKSDGGMGGSTSAPPAVVQAASEEVVREPQAPQQGRRQPAAGKAVPRPAPGPDWRGAARMGLFEQAFALAQAKGWGKLRRSSSADELLLLGRVARTTQHGDQALRAYQSLRRRFPDHQPAAALAAFHMARMYFDGEANHAAAVVWLRVYLEEQPRGALVEEARGRLVEALARCGRIEEARVSATRYLELHPTGGHVRFAREVLDRSH